MVEGLMPFRGGPNLGYTHGGGPPIGWAMSATFFRWFGFVVVCGLLPASAAWTPPEGFRIAPASVSPDGRYGVLVPDVAHYKENGPPQNQLVEVKSGAVLATIDAETFAEGSNGDLRCAWSQDGSVLVWYVEGHLMPSAYIMLKVEGDKVAWQVDVAKSVQQIIVPQAKSAAPENYAAAVKFNKGNGSAYPDGFTVTETFPEAGFTLPWQGRALLNSNPKNFPSSGPDTTIPPSANLGARIDFIIARDGAFSAADFQIVPALTAVPRAEDAISDASQLAASAEAERPSAAPAAGGTGPDLIPDFVATYVTFDNGADSAASLESYSADVDYFDHGVVNRDFIGKDKAAYSEKWPARSETITGTVKYVSAGDTKWNVTYPSHFYVLGADRSWMEGDAKNAMTVSLEGDNFHITSQSVAVSNVKKGRAWGEQFRVPKSSPLVTCEFPKPWVANYDDEGLGVEASLGDDITISVVPIDSTDVTGQTAEARKAIAKEGVKFHKQADGEESTTVNGIEVYRALWNGTYGDGPTTVWQEVWSIPSRDPEKAIETAILFTVWGAPEDLEKHAKVLEQIRHHIALLPLPAKP